MSEKIRDFHKLWHSDEWINARKELNELFDYNQIDALEKFTGKHPAVMQKRIAAKNWHFDPDFERMPQKPLRKFLHWIEHHTGWRIGEYKNYQLIK
jgi:hypothetical protein